MKLYVTLEQLKRQMRVEHKEDDELIEELNTVAHNIVEQELEDKLSKFEDDEGDIPPALKHAILLIATHYYENPSSSQSNKLQATHHSFKYLLSKFKKYKYYD